MEGTAKSEDDSKVPGDVSKTGPIYAKESTAYN